MSTMLSMAALTLLLLLFAFKVMWSNIRGPWKNAPPGPLFFPVMGSTLSLASKAAIQFPILAIDALVKKHGEVMRLTMGPQHTVFLSGLNSIKSYCSLEETTFRPNNPTLLEMYSDGKDLGMGIGLGGDRWREQRRFASKALRELGAGKKGMDSKIMEEVEYTIEDIRKRITEGRNLDRVDTYFDLPDLNVIWELVAGIRYDYDDPVPLRQFEHLRTFLQEKAAGPLTTLPWLKLLPPFSSIYRGIRRAMDEFRIEIKQVIAKQRIQFEEREFHDRGYIDMFLREQKEKRGRFFTDEDLVINCQDLFIGGSETTSKTLSSCFLQMVLHPEVQCRVQLEIDTVVGRERYVTMEDKASLPYTEAALLEVRRFSTPFPMTPPRTSSKDVIIEGYTIPAGVAVQMNIYSVLRGEKYFEDPHTFKPHRFLNEKGDTVVVPEAFIPFGYGKRRCLGENLAVVSNFIFFANLLQSFNFRCMDERNPPSTLPCGGLTYGPRPFDLRVSLRE